jgi:D-beta-D-heptose 7-phosphate kinase/D-beta-D-heptose 1-phosphate adenosyltransferase
MNTQALKKYKILLIGDNCVDVYQYGVVERISPEAPVPVFVPSHKEEREGMAGNVCANLSALGCEVNLLCGHKSVKTRLIDSRSKQQILRIDNDVKSNPIRLSNDTLLGYDAIVFSDYAKGTISYELIEQAIQTTIPVFIDTKKTDLACFHGAWVKVNETEYSKVTSVCSGLIVTLGSRGAQHQGVVYPSTDIDVVDITGAGDTFISALAYSYLETTDIGTAIKFANRAAGITVQHVGVYAPTLEEINETS